MQLKEKKTNIQMESFSIVGDLISYMRCPRSYRRIQRGNLTPSRPSQLWYGNFIHGIMEVLVTYYQLGISVPLPLRPTCGIIGISSKPNIIPKKPIDIDYTNYRSNIQSCLKNCSHYRCLYKVCADIETQLAAQGIYSRDIDMTNSAVFRIYLFLKLFCDELFPLISAAEIALKGIRKKQNVKPLSPKDFKKYKLLPTEVFYEINGIADVISQISMKDLYKTVTNLILNKNSSSNSINLFIIQSVGHLLYPNIVKLGDQYQNWLSTLLSQLDVDYPNGFEIIVDYKGQSRPSYKKSTDWVPHEDQMCTYKWLREQQTIKSPVICGILLYMNELYPSQKDVKLIIDQSNSSKPLTDVPLEPTILNTLKKKGGKRQDYINSVPLEYRIKRTIRVIDFTNQEHNKKSLEKFDQCVMEIEYCKIIEKRNGNLDHWRPEGEDQMCGTCDARYSCDRIRAGRKIRTVPKAP